MTEKAFRIGLAGLGTVGTGVIKIIQQHASTLEQRAGRPIEIAAVSARSKKDRGVDLSAYKWVDDAKELASEDLDCVVELIGGSEGIARTLVENSLGNGKHVVTANKALVAHHGLTLAQSAENKGVNIAYEAAVAGGIPIIKALREGFAANQINAVYGILNGTCNYILTEMRETGRDFGDVLKDAQEKGYAEADPTFDVEGVDAAHKLAILSSIAFGTQPDFDSLETRGISEITSTDIAFAQELGYRIKLLGIARRDGEHLTQSIQPCLVPVDSALGRVEDVFNAVFCEGDFVDTGLLVGRGAGEGPTASAVVADIVDLARGISLPTFGIPANDLKAPSWTDQGAQESAYYIRLSVLDQPGVIADITAILRDQNVSIDAFLQRGRDPGQAVPLVITTHEATQANVTKACTLIAELPTVLEQPCMIRLEHF